MEDEDEFIENMSRSQTQVVQSQGDGVVHKEGGVDGDANAGDMFELEQTIPSSGAEALFFALGGENDGSFEMEWLESKDCRKKYTNFAYILV